MRLSFSRTNGEVDDLIDRLIELAEDINHPAVVREMILATLKAGQDTQFLADLKLLNSTIKEMRYTNLVFGKYHHRKKVTIFGSARTEKAEPIYQTCLRFSRLLADLGYMVITGGGLGIMQAGNEGAGSENSFAANIRLPFEQHPNPVMSDNPRLITYKYFFNRKVAFVKETDAIAVFPGGFGTLDEAMEVSTLIQTGKTSPKPLVLVDDEDGYWERWHQFVKDCLLVRGLISAEDLAMFTITRDEREAVSVIQQFYRVYHSVRFVDGRLIVRLNKQLSDADLRILEDEFPDILQPGSSIRCCEPHPEELDEPYLQDLPRIGFHFDTKRYGLLMAFIGRINTM